jgi:hypothetical protein
VLHPQLRFDRVDLTVKRDHLVFRCHLLPNVADGPSATAAALLHAGVHSGTRGEDSGVIFSCVHKRVAFVGACRVHAEVQSTLHSRNTKLRKMKKFMMAVVVTHGQVLHSGRHRHLQRLPQQLHRPRANAKGESGAVVHGPESIECSKQADAKGLHGQERARFRANCKKKLMKQKT